MSNTLKYIVNAKGHKTSVLVPVKVWEDLNVNYQKLQKELDIFNGINEGRNAKKTGRKLQILKDFLSDSNG